MNRHFLRLYLSLAASIVAAVVLTAAIDRSVLRPERIDPSRWTEAEAAVREAYGKRAPEEAARAIEDGFGLHVRVLPPDAPETLQLPFREIVLADGRRLHLFWNDRPPLGLPLGALLGLLAASGALLWWMRRLDRSLGELARVAHRLGQRDLAARAKDDPRDPTRVLAVAFNDMAERIHGLVEAQQDLLTGVSHELRTPLMRLRFAVELLPDLQDADERARRVADIQSDIEAMDELIGELLAFARLRGTDALAPVDLAASELLAEIADETRRLAPERTVLAAPTSLRLHADRRLVLRALRNLATNAVRHGTGPITLSAEHRPGGTVALVVADRGPGIPAADRERVTGAFVRLNPSRADGGLGLGLALADRIAALHHGRLEIGDAPEGGARIALVLPELPGTERTVTEQRPWFLNGGGH